jgi:hypothetical protein
MENCIKFEWLGWPTLTTAHYFYYPLTFSGVFGNH